MCDYHVLQCAIRFFHNKEKLATADLKFINFLIPHYFQKHNDEV